MALASFAGLLADHRALFTDPVHFHGPATHDEGNQIVAEKLYALLLEMGFLPN